MVNYIVTKGALKVFFISSLTFTFALYISYRLLLREIKWAAIKVQKWISSRGSCTNKERAINLSFFSWFTFGFVQVTSYNSRSVLHPNFSLVNFESETSAWVSQIFVMFASLLPTQLCIIQVVWYFGKLHNFANVNIMIDILTITKKTT